MANLIRIKRRSSGGSAGAPSSLYQAELAYNESDAGNGIMYIGIGSSGAGGTATSVVPVGGNGAFLDLSTANQTVTAAKTFSGKLTLSGGVAGNTTFDNNLTVSGDLIVNGTTTTINSTTLTVDDKNIVLGDVASPTDAGADGGGITLKGASDKTLNWVDSTDSWTSSENFELASGKAFRINGSSVLNASTLGSGVTSSSLTSVGTIGTGTWQGSTIAVAYGGTGQTSFTDGQLLIGNTATGSLSKATLTAGTGISITNGNGTISIASSGANFTAGDGLTLTGSELDVNLKANGGVVFESNNLAVDLGASSITGTLAVGDGGTGQTSYTDGQLLIGNTAGGLSKATLTAGTNVSITNGNGTITIAATDTNTTYTAGDGLDLTSTTFSVDLKANGGLVIESTELAVDLGATSITGVLGAADGGTGVSNNAAHTITLGGAISTAGALTLSGAYTTTLTVTANTSVTLPTSGTLLSDGSTVDGGTF